MTPSIHANDCERREIEVHFHGREVRYSIKRNEVTATRNGLRALLVTPPTRRRTNVRLIETGESRCQKDQLTLAFMPSSMN